MIVSCKHCHHTWQYKGDLKMVTCPSCQYKTPTPDWAQQQKAQDKAREAQEEEEDDE